jgi:hypothetical protein
VTRDSLSILLEKYVRGSVPPPGMLDVRKRVESRLDTPTGRFDLQELEKAMKAQITEAALSAAKEQLAETRGARDKTADRIWTLVVGLLVVIIAALLAKLGLK